jgi:hypothetical protein
MSRFACFLCINLRFKYSCVSPAEYLMSASMLVFTIKKYRLCEYTKLKLCSAIFLFVLFTTIIFATNSNCLIFQWNIPWHIHNLLLYLSHYFNRVWNYRPVLTIFISKFDNMQLSMAISGEIVTKSMLIEFPRKYCESCGWLSIVNLFNWKRSGLVKKG